MNLFKLQRSSETVSESFQALPCNCKGKLQQEQFIIGAGVESMVYGVCEHVCRKKFRYSDSTRARREIEIYRILGRFPGIPNFYGHTDFDNLFLQRYRQGNVAHYFFAVSDNQKPLEPLITRWQWILDIAEAVEFLHSNGIYHQDLSTSQILLSDNRQHAVLCDFGGAYLVGEPHDPESVGSMGFSKLLEYNPPTPQQDIFALAACAYHIMTGLHMFEEILYPGSCIYYSDEGGGMYDTEAIVQRKCELGEFPPLPKTMPGNIESHIHKAWKGEYDSIKDLKLDWSSDVPTIATVTSDPWLPRLYISRERLATIAAATPLTNDQWEEQHVHQAQTAVVEEDRDARDIMVREASITELSMRHCIVNKARCKTLFVTAVLSA